MGDLSLHFSRWEFFCKCGKCKYSKDVLVHKKLLRACQTLRDLEGVSLTINSGARCEARNKATPGSAKRSLHIPREASWGQAGEKQMVLHAVDITFSDPSYRTPENIVRLYVRADQQLPNGLALYHGRIHMDFRYGGRWRSVHPGWSWLNHATA